MKINEDKLKKKIGFSPHKCQEEIIKSPARIKVISAGRRFGKSAVCAYEALKTIIQPNKKIWIVSPSYDLSQRVFDYFTKWFLKCFPSQKKAISYRPTPKCQLANGSKLECKSIENMTSLLGEELDLLIGDEAARWSRKVWESYLVPTLAMRHGRTFLISTPLGKNWFYEEFMRAKEEGGAFHFKSIDNPYFPKEEWERAKKTLPSLVFQQEYEALFLADAASVFRNIEEIVGDTLRDVEQNHFYVAGVDLGKHEDFTVITIIDLFTNEVVYWDRFKDIDWNIQKSRITGAVRRYNNAKIIIDSTGLGDPITDDLRSAGLLVEDFKYTNTTKQQMIQKLALFIEQKAIRIPNEPILIDELSAFGYEFNEATNRFYYSAPQGLHDDCVNSLGLAVWGLMGTANTRPKESLKDKLAQAHKRPKVESFI